MFCVFLVAYHKFKQIICQTSDKCQFYTNFYKNLVLQEPLLQNVIYYGYNTQKTTLKVVIMMIKPLNANFLWIFQQRKLNLINKQ